MATNARDEGFDPRNSVSGKHLDSIHIVQIVTRVTKAIASTIAALIKPDLRHTYAILPAIATFMKDSKKFFLS